MARTLTEEDIIDYGKYKGTKLKNIPATYLIWCFNNQRVTPEIKKYVQRRYLELLKQARKENENEKNQTKSN